jgi:exonuclease SbcC
MQLRRLRVRNIRSYEAGDLSFPPGTTLISGDVGSGKTSLLYAVEMALFGVAEVDAAYLVRHGAPHAEVEVEFEDSEHKYVVRRRFRRVHRKGKETFEPEKIGFKVDGEETTYSATELRQRVIELLGFPDNPSPQAHSDLWRWAVYVPQERMREILAARPQERLETVRKALGVERYRTAAENAQELAADLRRSAAGRRAEAERLAHYDREHAEWSAEADRLHVERGRLAELVARAEAEISAARSRRAEADQAVRETASVRDVLESLEREDQADQRSLLERAQTRGERLEEAERHRQEAELLQPEAEELAPRQSVRAEAEARRDHQRQGLDEHAGRLRELSEARVEAAATARQVSESQASSERADQDRLEALRQRDTARDEGPLREPPAPTPVPLATLDERLAKVREKEGNTLRALTRSQSGLSEIEELLAAGVCPRCGQPVTASAFEPHRAEQAAAVRAAEEAHQSAVAERTALEEERRSRERYERAWERWKEVEKRRLLAEATLEKADAVVRDATEATRLAGDAHAAASARLRSLEPAEAEDERLREALARADRDLKERADEVDRAAAAAERRRAALAALEALSAEIHRADLELEVVRRRLEERRERIETLMRTLEGAEERQRKLADADRRVAEAEAALALERETAVRVDARLDEAARRLAESERGRAERTAVLEEAEDLTSKAAWVAGPFRASVLGMEQELLAHAQQVFERAFARYFASLIDDPALVARTDVAFTPAVTIEGEWTPAEALSGGERTSLALAFRLALATVVRAMGSLRLETMLLDEPTDGFSPEQVVRMGELLEELALPQVVVVSHESQLAAIADRVVRVEKQEGRSVLLRPEATSAAGTVERGVEAEPAATPPKRTRARRRASP